MLPQPARDLYRSQQERIVAAIAYAAQEWATIGEDFDAGWARIGPRLTVLVTAAQLGAARAGAAYVPAALEAQGQSVTADAEVRPAGFAGIASDGRPLASLLYGAVTHARTVSAESLLERLAAGRRWLDMAVQTQVADAARDASMAAVTARPRVKWVRIVNPPCCQRCAVLAGHVYAHSTGFKRHPRCDCSMLPQTVANPDAVGMRIGPEDVKDLTRLQRRAIADGADFNKVINDYSRKGAWHLPPTRVDQLTAVRDRQAAVRRLQQAGYLAA